jgi:hypothetical protein
MRILFDARKPVSAHKQEKKEGVGVISTTIVKP